jgi:hypothetical protein
MWIKIEDSLPQEGEKVGVCVPRKNGNVWVGTALFVSNPPRFYVNKWADKGVKYWLRFPKPPKDILEQALKTLPDFGLRTI